MRRFLSIVIAVLFSLPALSQGTFVYPDSVSAKISEFAVQVMDTWKIPGMSLAVAHRGDVVLLEGYGVKKLGKSIKKNGPDAAVTPHTVFHIGSMTKAFTATVLASMVDEGLLTWNTPVKEILPEFDWADDTAEDLIQVQDLLTHRTGLVAQVGTYIPNLGYSREDIIRMLRYIEPMYEYDEKFAYNNITFLVAAAVVEKLSGRTWEENIRSRILEPLGMHSSYPEIQGYIDAGPGASVAHYFGHRRGSANGGRGSIVVSALGGEDRALEWVDVIGPAGSISSTAEDMIRWVEFHRADNFLLSPGGMVYLHTPQIKVSRDTTDSRHYGLCWYIEDHDGCEIIYHTGTTWGFTGICGWIPSLEVSFALLCNSEVSEYARKAVMRRIADLYNPERSSPAEQLKTAEHPERLVFQTDGQDTLRDWNSEGLEAWYRYRNSSRRRAVPCTIEYSRTKPSDYSKLVGVYSKAPLTADGDHLDPEVFGDVEITLKRGQLYITIGPKGWTHRLEHSQGNIFLFTSEGHTFPLYFHNYTPDSPNPVTFEIDFNYNENFGAWVKK